MKIFLRKKGSESQREVLEEGILKCANTLCESSRWKYISSQQASFLPAMFMLFWRNRSFLLLFDRFENHEAKTILPAIMRMNIEEELLEALLFGNL